MFLIRRISPPEKCSQISPCFLTQECGILLNPQNFFDGCRVSLIIVVIFRLEEHYLFIYCINVIPKVTLTWKRGEGVAVGYSQSQQRSCD
jgi:hypothetical protein